MKHLFKTAILILICYLFSARLNAQNIKSEATLFEGIVIGGYVDKGAFLNFTGPNISLSKGNSKFLLGMMPSLRFKTDNGTTKNTFITPSLGCGLSYSYKFLAIQIPLYYTPKTISQNGKWHVGIGVGLRLNALKIKRNS
jgi:hypothetical protein